MNLIGGYFNSIEDFPIWNWWKIAETGDLKYVFKDGKGKVTDRTVEVWFKLQNEYLDEYGITDGFRRLIKLKKKWIEKRTKYLVDDDRFALMESEMTEVDMDDIIKEKDVKTDETLIMLEQKLGRELDPKKISVKKYYDYINYFSKNG